LRPKEGEKKTGEKKLDLQKKNAWEKKRRDGADPPLPLLPHRTGKKKGKRIRKKRGKDLQIAIVCPGQREEKKGKKGNMGEKKKGNTAHVRLRNDVSLVGKTCFGRREKKKGVQPGEGEKKGKIPMPSCATFFWDSWGRETKREERGAGAFAAKGEKKNPQGREKGGGGRESGKRETLGKGAARGVRRRRPGRKKRKEKHPAFLKPSALPRKKRGEE